MEIYIYIYIYIWRYIYIYINKSLKNDEERLVLRHCDERTSSCFRGNVL